MSARTRTLWITLLTLTALVNQFSVNVVRPSTTYKVDALGGDATMVGIIAAAYAIIPLISAMSLGRLAQRSSTLTVLMASGLIIMAAGSAGIALSPTVWGMIAGTAALGFGQLVFTIGGQSAVSRVAGESNVDAAFGWFTAGVSAGQMLGPLAGGWIISSGPGAGDLSLGGIDASIWAGGLVTIPGAVVLLLTLFFRRHGLDRAAPAPRKKESEKKDEEKASALHILQRPRIGSHILASAGLLALTDILVAFVPLLGQNAGLTPTMVGLLLAIRGIGSLVSRLLLGYLTTRLRREVLLVISLLVSTVCFGVLPWIIGTFWLAMTTTFTGGFFLGLGQPLTMTIITMAVPPDWRSPALALRLVGNRLGQVVIPLTAGAIAAPAGPSGAIWVGAGVQLLSAAEQSRHLRRGPGGRGPRGRNPEDQDDGDTDA